MITSSEFEFEVETERTQLVRLRCRRTSEGEVEIVEVLPMEEELAFDKLSAHERRCHTATAEKCADRIEDQARAERRDALSQRFRPHWSEAA